jgi:hypothetical protein
LKGLVKLVLWQLHVFDMGTDLYYIATVPMYSKWLLGGMIVSYSIPIVLSIGNAYLDGHWSMFFLGFLGLGQTAVNPYRSVSSNQLKAMITFIFIITENVPQLIL